MINAVARNIKRVFDRKVNGEAWSESHIRDDWFRGHFSYAAPIIGDWFSGVMDIKQARLMDFGCGDGITDLGVVLRFQPRALVGVDITAAHEELPAAAERELGLKTLPDSLTFNRVTPGTPLAGSMEVDAVFSWSAFEHIERPFLDSIVADLYALLPQGGWFFLQIEPLYHSPFGSHLGRFLNKPWAHLLMDEASLWEAVLQTNDELPAEEKDISFHSQELIDYKRYIFGEYLKLNRLTADELVSVMQKGGFKVKRENRRQVDMPIPQELLDKYDEDVLRTNEVMLLLQKE